MFGFVTKIRDWFIKLPDKKRYFELITAFLSIPVLLSVIFINYLSIQERQKDEDKTPSPTPAVITIIERQQTPSEDEPTPKLTTSPTQSQCEPEIGPIEITSPAENENVDDNPLCITIVRNNPNNKYCSVVWSQRINSSSWSDFTDREICIYNMDSGKKTLELKVKSIVTGAEKTLIRVFNYENTMQIATPTLTNTPTPTVMISPTIGPTN